MSSPLQKLKDYCVCISYNCHMKDNRLPNTKQISACELLYELYLYDGGKWFTVYISGNFNRTQGCSLSVQKPRVCTVNQAVPSYKWLA